MFIDLVWLVLLGFASPLVDGFRTCAESFAVGSSSLLLLGSASPLVDGFRTCAESFAVGSSSLQLLGSETHR